MNWSVLGDEHGCTCNIAAPRAPLHPQHRCTQSTAAPRTGDAGAQRFGGAAIPVSLCPAPCDGQKLPLNFRLPFPFPTPAVIYFSPEEPKSCKHTFICQLYPCSLQGC